MSFKSDTPFIKDPKIKGIAINFRELIKIVPIGLIQSEINSGPDFVYDIEIPKTTPKSIPIIIFQCKAMFFIKELFVFNYFV